jgi:hypothetical protein
MKKFTKEEKYLKAERRAKLKELLGEIVDSHVVWYKPYALA